MRMLPPPTDRQMQLMVILTSLPILIGAVVSFVSDSLTPVESITGWLLLALGLVLSLGICSAMLLRRSIEIGPDALTLKHSFYTLRIARGENGPVTLSPLADIDQLNFTMRTNGIAGFGYKSGHFTLADGQRCFCAVSQGPLYRIGFKREGQPATLALSCDADTAEAIRLWIDPHGHGAGTFRPAAA